MEGHARRLAAAVDGLAGALRHAGASEAGSTRLIELAAIASLQSLALREELRQTSSKGSEPAPLLDGPLDRRAIVRPAA